MMLEALRHAVLEANLEVVHRGLVLYTFGNASGIDRAQGLVAIGGPVLPSGLTSTGLDDLLRHTPVVAVPVR